MSTVGLTYRHLNRQLVVAISFVIMTIVNSTLPVLPNLPVLYVCALISGFCSAIVMCSYTVWTIELWGARSGVFLYIEDFSYGIGSTVAEAVIKPYLTGKVESSVMTTTTDPVLANIYSQISYTTTGAGAVDHEIDRRSKLMLPFIVIGVCILPGKI